MKNQQYSNTTKVGLSPMASVLPFALFVATTISLSFFNAVNIDLLVATGIACGLAFLRGGTHKTLTLTIQNMASSITGMICDGGNHGCTMKGIVAVDAAYRSVAFAQNGIAIGHEHGINGHTPEDTMRNMGLIASPGMVKTEGVIVDIMREKTKRLK